MPAHAPSFFPLPANLVRETQPMTEQACHCLRRLIKDGNFFLARALLDRGVDPDRQGKNGNSALHLAVKSGDLRMVELVLGYGPDLSVRNRGNLTPMGLADRLGFRDIKARLGQAACVVTR